jgi:hypothetical protein
MRRRRRSLPSTLEAWFETVAEDQVVPEDERPTRAQLTLAAAWGLIQGLFIAALIAGGLWVVFFVVFRVLLGGAS